MTHVVARFVSIRMMRLCDRANKEGFGEAIAQMEAYYKIDPFAAIPSVGIGGTLLSTLMSASDYRHGRVAKPPEWHICCESMAYEGGTRYHMVFGRVQNTVAVRAAWNQGTMKKLQGGGYHDALSEEAYCTMVGKVSSQRKELYDDLRDAGLSDSKANECIAKGV